MKQFFEKNKFLIFVFFFTLLLRSPSLFEPYWYGDEGIYLTLGIGLRKGLFLYRQIFDNKPPLIYLLAAAAGNLFWFRFLLLVFCLGSVLLMVKLIKIFIPKNILAQRISLFVFIIFLNTPFIEGNITNAEIFQIFPTLLALWLVFRISKPANEDYFIAGVLFGLAVLLKVPAIFDFSALIFFLFFFSNHKKMVNLFSRLRWLVTGFFLPLLTTFSFFFYHHYLKEFIQITFFQNLGYLSSWKTGTHKQALFQGEFVYKTIILFFLLGLLLLLRRKTSSSWTTFAQIWFSLSLFAALLSGRPYGHYLIQVLPAFSLLAGVIITAKKPARLLIIGLFALLFFVFRRYDFWTYPVFSYYQNFCQFVTGKKSKIDYMAYFDKKTPLIYQMASYIKNSIRPNEQIFVWGDEPYLFALTRRLPSGRFTVAYHIIDFEKFKETEDSLLKKPPKIIVFDQNKRNSFPNLESLIASQYFKVKSFENFEIYRFAKL